MNQTQLISRFTKTGLVISFGIGSYWWIKQDEGTARSLQFWSRIFPIYLHYRTLQFLNRDIQLVSDETANRLYEQLHIKYSGKVKSIVYEMKGFYLKNAQLLSTQDDFVPHEYMKWVKDTQDNVPSEFIGINILRYQIIID